jgi:microcin C transport system permease protein
VRPRWNPLTLRKLRRFREIRRGYWSFLVLVALFVLSLGAELLISSRALAVRYEGRWSFPTYSAVKLGAEFGLEGPAARSPVNYRVLKQHFEARARGGGDANGGRDLVILPPVPYDPFENDSYEGVFKPAPPNAQTQHYLGTDSTGRDILARVVYGFRIALFFALAFMALTYLVGISVGCLMGWFGGKFDLLMQRLIEVWSNIPFLYMVIIAFSIIPTSFAVSTRIGILLVIMVLFSWTSMTYYMRTATYREKERDYTAAAMVLGASTPRIIFNHIIPNVVSTIVTFMPFTVVNAITAVTALDFLGWGLPPPTPSIGELLKQGTANLTTAPWIVTSAFVALVFILTLVTFIGGAVREAFDPRRFTVYK